MTPIARQINELEQQFQSFSDDELRGMTAAWKEDLAKLPTLEEQWKRLDEILPEAFALVKNAARRLTERGHTFTVCDQPMKWEMVHFDVQLIGGIVLHRGKISEMGMFRTAERLARDCDRRPTNSTFRDRVAPFQTVS